MNQGRTEYEELLQRIPAFRRGELSPSEAHKISLLLQEDEQFAREVEREEILQAVFGGMKSDPLPRGLVNKSVRMAVGEAASGGWFSIDTLLIALGVGIASAGASQFLVGKVNLLPSIGQWLGSLAGIAVDQSLGGILGAITLGSIGLLVGGVAWVVRMMRG